MAATVTIAHLSDLHFGGYADLAQIETLEKFLPTIGAGATVVSGDLSQRARHGEFQAAHAFLERLRTVMPVLVVPGNHDIAWWRSPLGLAGEARKYAKYTRYFGDLRPVMEIPGAIIAGALSSYGVALGSLTWNLRDVAVKGHLPAAETERVKAIFARAPAGTPRILTFHHNVLPGGISHRMGLARWRSAYRRLVATGADVILCGHDHQEGAGQIEGAVAVSTSGTHSSRARGGRPSVFNLVRVDDHAVHIQHFRWEAKERRFLPSDAFSFARAGAPKVAVSVAGGDQAL
ncbi:MAG TPA: metallophosphoesterase [Gemmatimonadales bacterium]|nr:metallophosphoesterase [Gemmatimonadales bacterium]